MKAITTSDGSDSIKKCQAKKLSAEHTKWVCNSNNCINMKLVQQENQLYDEDGYFNPTYTNQVIA